MKTTIITLAIISIVASILIIYAYVWEYNLFSFSKRNKYKRLNFSELFLISYALLNMVIAFVVLF